MRPAAAAAAAAAAARVTVRNLHRHRGPADLPPVQRVARTVCVTPVPELHKPKPVLHVNLADPPKVAEVVLQVACPHVRVQPSHIQPRHLLAVQSDGEKRGKKEKKSVTQQKTKKPKKHKNTALKKCHTPFIATSSITLFSLSPSLFVPFIPILLLSPLLLHPSLPSACPFPLHPCTVSSCVSSLFCFLSDRVPFFLLSVARGCSRHSTRRCRRSRHTPHSRSQRLRACRPQTPPLRRGPARRCSCCSLP